MFDPTGLACGLFDGRGEHFRLAYDPVPCRECVSRLRNATTEEAVTDWQVRTSNLQVGDRVAVAARYLRNTGQHTGDICFARGTVTDIKPLGQITLAVIAWEPLNGSPPDVPEKMAVGCLSRVTERGILDYD
jgi:hypothetical protein